MDAPKERLAGRFEIVRKIGEGGHGRVFEARDEQTDERLALKLLPKIDGERLYKFKREFRALDDLDHPNLIDLRELHNDGDTWFYTMEYVTGEDFWTYVRRANAGPGEVGYDEKRLRSALSQLVEALELLHSTGRIHRDVKPDNIMVDDDGRVVLLDFGLVAEREAQEFPSITQEDALVGTVAYMSPEQALSSNDVDASTDWYAVGIMLYEALTGELPFTGHALRVLLKKQMERPKPPAERILGASEQLSDLAMELILPEPEERPGAAEILQRLGAAKMAAAADARRDSAVVKGGSDRSSFVGRQEELAELEQAWEQVHSDTVAVVVTGEAGVGKSVLAREFIEQLRQQHPDLVALIGRCYERESVPYKALDGVIDALSHFLKGLDDEKLDELLPDDLTGLSRVFPVLGRVPAVRKRVRQGRNLDDNPRGFRFRAFEALRSILTNIGRNHPLVLLIDDIHWADSDSLVLLQDLIDASDSPAMLFLATARPLGPDEAKPLEYQLRERNVRWLEVEGLSTREVEELVDTLSAALDIDPEDDVRERWLDEAAGHPLLLQELVRFHAREGGVSSRKMSVEDLIWARVEFLGTEVQELVEVCSTVGIPLPLSVLKVALDREFEELRRAAQLGRSVHLLRMALEEDVSMVEPYHDRVRAAALRRLTDRQRVHYQERLVEALRETGFDEREPMAFVQCLVEAGRDEEAAREALEAASTAADALAFEKAAELYKLARRLGDYDRKEDRRIGRRIADNLLNAGYGAEAAEFLLEVARTASTPERFDLRRRAAEALMAQGRVARGKRILASLLEEVGESLPTSRLRLLLGIVWHRFWLWMRGLNWTRRDESEISDEDLRRLELFGVVRRMGISDVLLFFYFQTKELRFALKLGYEPSIAQGLALEGSNRAASGTRRGQERARELQSRALEVAEELDSPWHLRFVQTTMGLVDFACARFERAARTLGENLAWFESRPLTEQYILNTYRALRMNALFFWGDLNEVRRLYDQYLRDATDRGDKFMEVALRWWCNYIFLVDGRPQRAREVVDEVEELVDGEQLPLQPGNKAVALAHVALYEGTVPEEFDRYIGDIEGFLDTQQAKSFGIIRTMVRWLKGRLLLARHASGELDGYEQKELAKVLQQLDDEDLGPAEVYAESLRAGLALRYGDRARAIRHLRHVVRVGEDYDLRLITACNRLRLSELLDGERAEKERERAMVYMAEQFVREPEKIMRVYAFDIPES